MTIAPPEGGAPLDQSAEPWMPNGFPPPSFVVEAERTTTFAAGRGRWLAAAAILGALLLIAGLLLIARSGDDRTDLASRGSTSTSTDLGVVPTPDPVVDPTQSPAIATLPPVGPTETVPGAGATTVTTAAAPAGPTVPPPPPGVLTPSSTSVSLPTAFNPAPSRGTIELRNTGPSALEFTSQTSTGLSVAPASGAILPGGAVTVTLTLNGAGIREGEYNGSVAFGGSGGTRSVQVRSVVANPPGINPTRPGRFANSTVGGKTVCEVPWQVEATVSDASGIKTVVALIARSGGTPSEFSMKPDPNRRGVYILERPQEPVTKEQNVTLRVRAVDTHNAEAITAPEAVTCP